jgi:hypothetical protein
MEGLKSELERFRLQAVATARRGEKESLLSENTNWKKGASV